MHGMHGSRSDMHGICLHVWQRHPPGNLLSRFLQTGSLVFYILDKHIELYPGKHEEMLI